MKKILLLTLILLNSVASAADPYLPNLFFSYSWLYDSVVCEATPVQKDWASEMTKRTPEFVDLWQQEGSTLFQALFDKTGRGFSRKEMTATFSVCPKKPSYSDPLVLNMARYMESYMGAGRNISNAHFVDLVFHELLHTWVDENLDESILWEKYINELPSVRSHLHLMAIQKFVYIKLGRNDLLALLDKKNNEMGGVYKRAWEIVNLEGYEAFINELPVK